MKTYSSGLVYCIVLDTEQNDTDELKVKHVAARHGLTFVSNASDECDGLFMTFTVTDRFKEKKFHDDIGEAGYSVTVVQPYEPPIFRRPRKARQPSSDASLVAV